MATKNDHIIVDWFTYEDVEMLSKLAHERWMVAEHMTTTKEARVHAEKMSNRLQDLSSMIYTIIEKR